MAQKTNEKRKKDNSPKIPPNNLEAEQAVLCSALIDSLAAETIMGQLTSKDFYSETHKIIFDAMKQLYNSSSPIDFVTVVDLLEKKDQLETVGGIGYLTTVSNAVPSSAYHSHYTRLVKRDSVLRQLIETCSKITSKAYETDNTELLAEAEKEIFEIGEKGSTSSLESMSSAFNEAMSVFEEINRDGGMKRGVRTGFIAFDKKTGGFQNSNLIIIAARPGVGKTSLAMNIVTNAAIDDGKKCAIFNFEMSRTELAQRMLCSVAGVDMTKAKMGELTEHDWVKLWKAQKKLENAPIYCNDSSLNKPANILAQCRKLKRERGLDLIVVDYLQIMESDTKADNGNRQVEVSEMSRKMKVLAKEIDVPVIVLSQMVRGVEKEKRRPQLSDLRESGAIEQDADMVIFIDKKTQGDDEPIRNQSFVAELIIAKFRNGEPGSVNVGWDGNRVSFVNLSNDQNEKSLEQAYESMHGGAPIQPDNFGDVFADLPESELGEFESFIAENQYDLTPPPVDEIFDN